MTATEVSYWLEKRTRELFGVHTDEALAILYGPKRGCRDSDVDDIRRYMLWLANGDLAELARVQEMADSDWRDVVSEYQAECNLERFRKPPRRNWKLDD
jgi:hypothetical protein